jgi:probable F420-dependent oxidoreductase
MKAAGVMTGTLGDIGKQAQALEANGADIAATLELGHDPLMQLAMAANATENIQLMSSITVAFGRSPMILAQMAHDVNALAKGRLTLGIGSQIKPHIEKRYSMPWSKPAARMREYILAMKAIWACWYEGKPLDFRGEFYTHTLMTPMFTPTDTEYGAPAVVGAAVGPLMTENVAEVADGIILHSFTTEEYIRSVTLPAVEKGLAKGGRDRSQFEIHGTPFYVTGETEEEFNAVKAAACGQIAFYASTPAYRGVLESVGYGDLQPELTKMSKEGRWLEMGGLIDDTLLDRIAIIGEPGELTEKLRARYADIFDTSGSSVFTGAGYAVGEFSPAVANAIKSV